MLLKFIALFSLLLTFAPAKASETSTYSFGWLDQDKEVYVLQNRTFKKDGAFHFSLGAGYNIDSTFVNTFAYQVRGGYFFNENWGFELLYDYSDGKENDAGKAVRNKEGLGGGSTPFYRKIENYYGGFLLWSPFYAKINTFNKIIYLDWIIGAGVGQVTEKNNSSFFKTVTQTESFESEKHIAYLWETTFRFYISQMWHVRFDLVGMHYQATSPQNGSSSKLWYQNYDALLSLGMSL